MAKLRSPGQSQGRRILDNLQTALGSALGHDTSGTFDIRSERNVELVATLLADARAGQERFIPGALVLPPGVDDRLRWLSDWPDVGPPEGVAWLGVPPDAEWTDVIQAAYARFEDHWVAAVAYHF